LKLKYKRWVLTYFSFAVVVPTLLGVGFYVYDPLMLFHKPFNRGVTLSENMRLQAPGVIAHLDHDSYILGTSMLLNTSGNEAGRIIGGNFANISMRGGDYYERSYALSYALKAKGKNIIYSLDDAYLDQKMGDPHFPVGSFSYLYSNRLGRVWFYLQWKYIKCLFKWSKGIDCVGRQVSADRPNQWIGEKENYERFGGLENWFAEKTSNRVKKVYASISATAELVKKGEYELLDTEQLNVKKGKAIKYIEDNLLSYVRAYPDRQFHLFFPPYSRIKYAIWHQQERSKASIHEAVVRYFAKASTELENLSVYGYEDQSFLDDLSNYKDVVHYDEWVNQQMINDIAENKHLITPANVDGYLEQARSKAFAFDVVALGNRIDVYLKAQRIEK